MRASGVYAGESAAMILRGWPHGQIKASDATTRLSKTAQRWRVRRKIGDGGSGSMALSLLPTRFDLTSAMPAMSATTSWRAAAFGAKTP